MGTRLIDSTPTRLLDNATSNANEAGANDALRRSSGGAPQSLLAAPVKALAGVLGSVARLLAETGERIGNPAATPFDATRQHEAAGDLEQSLPRASDSENHPVPQRGLYRVRHNWVQAHPIPSQQANSHHLGSLERNLDYRDMPLPGAVADALGTESATPTQPMANGGAATPERLGRWR